MLVFAVVHFRPITSADGHSLSRTRQNDTAFYSTVTDFARLRGWSTSVPLSTAVW